MRKHILRCSASGTCRAYWTGRAGCTRGADEPSLTGWAGWTSRAGCPSRTDGTSLTGCAGRTSRACCPSSANGTSLTGCAGRASRACCPSRANGTSFTRGASRTRCAGCPSRTDGPSFTGWASRTGHAGCTRWADGTSLTRGAGRTCWARCTGSASWPYRPLRAGASWSAGRARRSRGAGWSRWWAGRRAAVMISWITHGSSPLFVCNDRICRSERQSAWKERAAVQHGLYRSGRACIIEAEISAAADAERAAVWKGGAPMFKNGGESQ